MLKDGLNDIVASERVNFMARTCGTWNAYLAIYADAIQVLTAVTHKRFFDECAVDSESYCRMRVGVYFLQVGWLLASAHRRKVLHSLIYWLLHHCPNRQFGPGNWQLKLNQPTFYSYPKSILPRPLILASCDETRLIRTKRNRFWRLVESTVLRSTLIFPVSGLSPCHIFVKNSIECRIQIMEIPTPQQPYCLLYASL